MEVYMTLTDGRLTEKQITKVQAAKAAENYTLKIGRAHV
jgi:hypothetical protein